ncbi:uncharacterized protein LOC116198608 [Punica granatum]|uniref:Insecticidal crystal toxin domain-containing protein n=2 Tax=Punica granatum TaxID=22663 RepID=A0A218XXU0_PUNGR|nr:uncharacterized protein LOC116198608 [Punica granatum]OWM89409.1 hypothetical protein CDL15_Pgr024157 [Punica granatum]PKI62525.1 hypothetical protein CRG98_017149 [Punica granatum]
MYVTRPLSLCLRNPGALSEPPPEGPSSGFLVVQDEEAESTCCFGLCEDTRIRDLPFPQNKNLTIRYTTSQQNGTTNSYRDDVILIPVLNKPLSSNQYYAIQPRGRHKGEAHANSKDEDMTNCLCFSFVHDADPVPLNPHNIYQQFVIDPYETLCTAGSFSAKSLASDGHPPRFLRRKGWRVYSKKPKNFYLGEAPGIFDRSLRAQLPSFDVGTFEKSSQPVLVGRWYCPFMFVRDGALGDQVKRSTYYEMTLQQRWEQVYACENDGLERREPSDRNVLVDVSVKDTAILVGGKEAKHGNVANGILCFVGDERESCGVGLSLGIIERMKWEEERFGWVSGDDNGQLRVKRVEEIEGSGSDWKRFGCYVLVESFVLKRMEGSLVMSYDFRHTQHVRCKWE